MATTTILIVEDEFISAVDLQERLERLGYEVVGIVASGREAIKSAAELRPDLVLMDMVLQGDMDGAQAAEKISSLSIPVIFLTAYSDPATIEKVKKTSPYGYLIKPYDDSVLEVSIKTSLEKWMTDQKAMDKVRKDAVKKSGSFEDEEKSETPIPRIVIVEDQFITAHDLKDRIETKGYKVVAMESTGVDAIKTCSEIKPDVVLMDIILNGDMDGTEAAQKINEMGIPVVFLTAHGDKATMEKALKTAPYAYLLKPFDDQQIHTTLEMVLQKKKTEKAKQQKLGKTIVIKEEELKLEKTGVFFVTAVICSLTIYGIVTRSMTWLMYLLFIPACYNIFLLLVSLQKKEKPVPYEKPPLVSILVPAHNEEFTIEKCVQTMSKLDYYQDDQRNYEVIVINDGSTDKTGEILSSLKETYDFLRIVTRKPPRAGKGKGYVLNDGIRVAQGDLIAVFDADAQVDSDFLSKAVPYLNEDKVAGVQARVRMYNKDKNLLTAMQDAEFSIFGNGILRSRDIMGKNGFLGGNGQITTRQAIEEIEGWDGYAVTEDLNMSIKLMIKGYKIRYCGETAVWQEAVPYWKPFFRQRVRWATGSLETLFVYLAPIIDANIPLYKKIDSIQYLLFLLLIAFVMLGYVVAILNISMVYVFQMNAPLIIALISTIAFFPGAILGIYRGNKKFFRSILISIEYWAYCFYLLPLFFAAFLHMVTRKDRKWAKTHHSGE